MFNWLREWMEFRAELREKDMICPTCEVLKVELSNVRREKDLLLRQVLTPREPEPERLEAPEPQVVNPRHTPWKVRQQLLEAEDRGKARAIEEFKKRDAEARAQAPIKISPTDSIEQLESNLGIVAEK